MRIEPTTGRVVLFLPAVDDGRHEDGLPFAALLAGVNADSTINLMVAARDGSPYGVQNIVLVQDGDDFDLTKAHAFWMPYQKGQAAKTEALQASTTIGTAVDLAPVHERIATVATEAHDKIAGVEQAVTDKIGAVETATQTKFEELGGWLTGMFKQIEAKLADVKPAAAPAPATPDAPAAAATTEAKPATEAAGAAPQAAS